MSYPNQYQQGYGATPTGQVPSQNPYDHNVLHSPGGSPPFGQPQGGIPMAARVLAYVVSSLKILPLIALFIFAVLLFAGGESVDDFFSELLDDDFSGDPDQDIGFLVAGIILMVIVLIGLVLTIGQIVAAAKNSKVGLIIFAAMMTGIDALGFIGSALGVANGSSGIIGLVMITVIGGTQLYILIAASMSKPVQR